MGTISYGVHQEELTALIDIAMGAVDLSEDTDIIVIVERREENGGSYVGMGSTIGAPLDVVNLLAKALVSANREKTIHSLLQGGRPN